MKLIEDNTSLDAGIPNSMNNDEVLLAMNKIIARLKNELSIKTADVNSLRTNLSGKDIQVEDLNRSLEKYSGDIKSAKELISRLHSELENEHDSRKIEQEKMRQLIEHKNNETTLLSNKLSAVEKLLSESEEKNVELSNHYESIKNEQEKMRQLIEHKNNETTLLSNKLSAVEKLLSESEEKNKEILNKSMIASERHDKTLAYLASLKKELEEKEETYKKTIENVKQEFSEKSTKKVVILMGQLEGLKRELQRKDSLFRAKNNADHNMMVEIISKLKSHLEKNPTVEEPVFKGMSPSELIDKAKNTATQEDFSENRTRIPNPASTQPESLNDIFDGLTAESEEEEIESSPFEVDISLLEPMVERAMEQGESDEEIIESLVCSGYQKKDIDSVLSRLR